MSAAYQPSTSSVSISSADSPHRRTLTESSPPAPRPRPARPARHAPAPASRACHCGRTPTAPRMSSTVPSTASTVPSVANRTARAATAAGSLTTAPGSRRDTSVPSGVYARSANASAHRRQPGVRREREPPRARHAEHRERRVEQPDRLDDRGRLLLVVADRVVQRAVRLHVPAPGRPPPRRSRTAPPSWYSTSSTSSAGGDVDEPAAEPGEVAVADVRADRHPVLDRGRRTRAASCRGRRRGSRTRCSRSTPRPAARRRRRSATRRNPRRCRR